MQKSISNKVIHELQMYTGVMSNDINYMVYLMVKDGIKKKEQEFTIEADVDDLEDWFNDIDG